MMTNISRPSRPPLLAAAAAFFCGALTGTGAAQTTFDGVWAVQIVALNGDCPARVIPIAVEDGLIRYSAFGATAEGAVAADGSLKVNFAHAEDVVRASGAVDGAIGKGSWRSSACEGSWTARRS